VSRQPTPRAAMLPAIPAFLAQRALAGVDETQAAIVPCDWRRMPKLQINAEWCDRHLFSNVLRDGRLHKLHGTRTKSASFISAIFC